MHHLSKWESGEHTFEDWFVTLGMIEGTLFDEIKREDISFHMGLSAFQMQKLVYTVDTICRRNLMSTLEILQKDQLVDHEIKEYIVKGATRKQASAEERKQIQVCKDTIRQEMGYDSMFSVLINPTRGMQFYEKLNAMCKEKYGWDRTYTVLEISTLDAEQVDKYAELDVDAMMKKLNDDIKSAVTARLRSECEKGDQKALEAWENNAPKLPFQLDPMTTESLIFILYNEL